MLERPFELGDLEPPVVELTPEQAGRLRGGMSDGLDKATDASLPAIQDKSSGKVKTQELHIVKVQDSSSP
jgi:hypothetical protein